MRRLAKFTYMLSMIHIGVKFYETIRNQARPPEWYLRRRFGDTVHAREGELQSKWGGGDGIKRENSAVGYGVNRERPTCHMVEKSR